MPYITGRPFVKRFALYVIVLLPAACPVCLSCLSASLVYCGQTVRWHGCRLRPRPHCVRWGPSSPPQKGHSPNFRPMSVVAKRLDGLRCHLVRSYRLRPQPRRRARWGPRSPKTGAQHPQFWPMSIVAKRWIDQDETWHGATSRPHCVRRGPSIPQKGRSPIFGPYLLWPNGWMGQDATWYGGRPRPRRHC